LVTEGQDVDVLEEKSGCEGVDDHIEVLLRRWWCRRKDLWSKAGPKVKTSERFNNGAHLGEGIKEGDIKIQLYTAAQ